MSERKELTTQDMLELVNVGIKEGKDHARPSPETIKMFQELREEIIARKVSMTKELSEEMDKVRQERRQEMEDMRKTVEPVVDALKSAQGAATLIRWVLGTVITIGGAIAVIKGWK